MENLDKMNTKESQMNEIQITSDQNLSTEVKIEDHVRNQINHDFTMYM